MTSLTPESTMTKAIPTSPLTVQICDDLSQLPFARSAWNKLLDASAYPCVFRRHEWLSIWWKWFGAGRKLHVIQVFSGPNLVGVLPLYQASGGGQFSLRPRKLTLIGAGGPTCPEYLGPIVHRDHTEAIVRELSASLISSPAWDGIEFPDIPPDDAATLALAEALAKERPMLRLPGMACPYLDLPDSYESFLERLGRHGHKRECQRVRKAVKTFRVELELIDNVNRFHDVFPQIVELNRSSRALHGDLGPFDNTRYAGFHREVIESLLPCGVSQIYLLRFDGKPVAFQYGYLDREKYYDFQNGFDSRLKTYSPGAVLLQLIIQHLIAGGVKEFDFLRGDESYKDLYATCRRCTVNFHVFRRKSAMLASRLLRHGLVPRLRRLVRRCLRS